MPRKTLGILVSAVSAVFGLLALPAPADAHPYWNHSTHKAVFVQTNDPSGNQIVAYERGADGVLNPADRYETGGLGGALGGAVVDKLASQGSLTYDPDHRLLLAVNAGSGSITSFQVRGDRLSSRQVLGTGPGSLPVSIAVHGDLVYVLDASGPGRVTGFRIFGRRLAPLPASTRSLGLTAGAQPQFLNTPAQIGFTPDGRHVIVTTKANGSMIDVFDVRRDGSLSNAPVSTPSATPVPFAFTFDSFGRLVVGEAGTSTLSTYRLGAGDRYQPVASLTDGQQALCWIARAGDFYYVANAASATISAYGIDRAGRPSLVGANGVVANTDPGPIDLTVSSDGNFLYAQTGANGIVDEFAIGHDGSLHEIGSQGGLGIQQIEGIAAT